MSYRIEDNIKDILWDAGEDGITTTRIVLELKKFWPETRKEIENILEMFYDDGEVGKSMYDNERWYIINTIDENGSAKSKRKRS